MGGRIGVRPARRPGHLPYSNTDEGNDGDGEADQVEIVDYAVHMNAVSFDALKMRWGLTTLISNYRAFLF
jgi:hypothetical protein